MTKANETDDHSFRTGKYRFRPPFVTPAHPDEVAFSWLTYDLSRYFFEFMRNFLVVGALRYAADKTENQILSYLFWGSILAFYGFVFSFICFWNLRLISFAFPKSDLAQIIDLLLSVVLALAITLPLYEIIIYVTGEMSAVHQ
jgi:hypothetical protein